MAKFARILAPVEFSPLCRDAVQYADVLACHFKAEVILLHVCLPAVADYSAIHTVTNMTAHELAADVAVERLSELDSFPCGVPVRRMVRQGGDPAEVILEVAAAEKCDLIVMPTHGHSTLRRFLHGSLTCRVLHDATCPVWTGCHMEQAPNREGAEFRNILCAVDLGPHSHDVVCWGAEFTREFGGELIVVHAVPLVTTRLAPFYFDPDWTTRQASQACERIAHLLRETQMTGSVEVRGGGVAEVVDEVAERKHANLIVIGHGTHSIAHPHLPNHAYAIIRQSPCPVVAV
jgi:nucleotide-binding universal stress UspA family protein